jgi:hypothetical protein
MVADVRPKESDTFLVNPNKKNYLEFGSRAYSFVREKKHRSTFEQKSKKTLSVANRFYAIKVSAAQLNKIALYQQDPHSIGWRKKNVTGRVPVPVK